MQVKRVVSQLKLKYPGKKIIMNNRNRPTEIVCEVEPTREHLDYSRAIAVIDKSLPHYHQKTTEEYRVIRGILTLHVGSDVIPLKQSEKFTIFPDKLHWAEGKETWVECYSTPGWVFSDHISSRPTT